MDLLSDSNFQTGLQRSLEGDHSGAILAFEIAANRFADSAELHYEIGLAYQRRAETSMPAALRLNDPGTELPTAGLASSVGGVLNAFLGLAVVGASKAVGQTDWIVQYRDDFRSSAAAFERSIAIDPDYAPAYYALAHSLRYLGQNETAAQQASKAAQLVPGNRHYQSRSQAIDAGRSAREVAGGAVLTWNDVILPERTKRELKQMQLLLEQPGLSRELGIDPMVRRGLAKLRSPGCWHTSPSADFFRQRPQRSILCGSGSPKNRSHDYFHKPVPMRRRSSFSMKSMRCCRRAAAESTCIRTKW